MTSENEQNENLSIEVKEMVEHDDGSATIMFDVDDAFCDWWLRDQGLEEFNQDAFDAWFIDALKKGLDLMETNDAE